MDIPLMPMYSLIDYLLETPVPDIIVQRMIEADYVQLLQIRSKAYEMAMNKTMENWNDISSLAEFAGIKDEELNEKINKISKKKKINSCRCPACFLANRGS
jgi:c-di-GMP-related signal transduction protein